MKKLYTISFFIAAALFHNNSKALEYNSSSPCAEVYTNNTRNIEILDKSNTEKKLVFYKHCELNGSYKSSNKSDDLSGSYKFIDADFSGTQSEIEQHMQSFCKEFSKDLAKTGTETKYNNSVVVDSYKSFNECRKLELAGVRFTQSIQLPEVISVTAAFNPNEQILRVDSIEPVNLSCRTSGYTWNSRYIDVTKIDRPFNVKQNLTISCRRSSTTTPKGKIFERASLTVDTNHGPYSIVLQPDTLLGFDLASEAKQRTDILIKKNDELEKSIAQERNENRVERQKSNANEQTITALRKRPRLKPGNNGTVSCQQFCVDPRPAWGGFSAQCIVGYWADNKYGVHCNDQSGQDITPRSWTCVCEGE